MLAATLCLIPCRPVSPRLYATSLCPHRIDRNKERISEVGGIKALVHQCLNAKDVDQVMGTNPAVRQQIDAAIKAFWESTAKKFAPAGQLKMQM